ncbi:molybdopterin converting factor subunit 1 [Enhygromyxa salina]|uniref:molybdopterin converting factor subunit 1 n=1 Tax=Enhygromyxa salina TaxID=215803 RepID=UPI000696ADC6|nr:molybdopterin converting factor subunit 1 [Enhygromyxa salina]
MRVTVLLFAGLRQRIGAAQVELELSEPATVGQLRERICAAHPEVGAELAHCRVAVDHEFVGESGSILAGQEVALIPPVSGGAPVDHAGQRSVLRETALSLAEVVAAVEHRNAGGVTTFTGNVREHSRGKTVRWLEYEAYPAMAVAKMDEIALAVEAEIPGARVALQHRVGRLEIGETAVVIAASAPHRDEAFRACREVIERLKQDVPIWKKEIDSDGGEWIGQGP